jgi:Fe-S-cluster containining protein
LNFHAAYRCRHSGACCRAGWAIPFGREERQTVQRLRLQGGSFMTQGNGVTVASRHADGTCTFFEGESHLCAIHHAGGQDTLPLSCRMFPRVVLHDGRGTLISLSHFCPTAAGLLFDESDACPSAVIVEAPAGLTDAGPLDGLDARGVWPPLLRPGVMMDLESYAAWERLGVELVLGDGVPPHVGLDALDAATGRITVWSPDTAAPLLHTVLDAFSMVKPAATGMLETHDGAVKRWLAARLFGNWIAYQADGLEAIVHYLRACLATFTTELARDGSPLEAIRRSDLQIVHKA